MSWFRVDDKLFCHPKWLACSPHARALWITAGSWAAAQNDGTGNVPRHVLGMLGGRPRDAGELEANGLWEPQGNGWVFHDWVEFQPSAEQIEAKRSAAAERQRRARDRKRESRRDDGVSHAPITHPPTRPVPRTPPTPPDPLVRPAVPDVEQVRAEHHVDPKEVAPMPADLQARISRRAAS